MTKKQYAKTEKIWLIITLAVISALVFLSNSSTKITGNAILGVEENEGCCDDLCKYSSKEECTLGKFHQGKKCHEITECNVGCCIDTEGYCLGNYLKSNCDKNNLTFISTSECRQYLKCITEPAKGSLTGFTGYPFVLKTADMGIPFSEPFTGEKGTKFTIKFKTIEKTNTVAAKINAEGYETKIDLYDDGYHNDNFKNDDIFAGQWDSSEFPEFKGIKKLNYAIEADGEKSAMQDYVLLTSTNCEPLLKSWEDPAQRKDVVFVQTDSKQLDLLNIQASKILNKLAELKSEEINKINFYKLTKAQKSSTLKSTLQTECEFYNHLEDKTLVFDPDLEKCKQTQEAIFINSNFNFKDEIVDIASADEFFNNFCKYVMTEKELNETIRELLIGPNITWLEPVNNSYFPISDIKISFMINDNKDKILPYKVYLDINADDMILAKGNANANEKITLNLPLNDGHHFIFAEATDSDENLGHSDQISVVINVSNFVITVLSLEPLYHNNSPDINFTISHLTDQKINYTVFADNSILSERTTNSNAFNSLKTQLKQGIYTIKINATDAEGKTTSSLPYLLYVGIKEDLEETEEERLARKESEGEMI